MSNLIFAAEKLPKMMMGFLLLLFLRSRPSSWCKFRGGDSVSIIHAAMVGKAGIASSMIVFMVSSVM
jgi:hypothetical protein